MSDDAYSNYQYGQSVDEPTSYDFDEHELAAWLVNHLREQSEGSC